MRDLVTNKLTNPEHWMKFRTPDNYTVGELSYEQNIPEGTIVKPTYDPNCSSDNVSGGCKPVAVISGERLLQSPTETQKIGNILKGKPGISDYLIDDDAWNCIWTEIIVNKKGEKNFLYREGQDERNYNFSEEMLGEMLNEFDRLIQKYGSTDWYLVQTAVDLLVMLFEHRSMVEQELMEVRSGERQLQENDFLGPKERTTMKV